MKSKTLNVLKRTEKVLLFILIPSALLEVILFLLPGNLVSKLPDIWSTYNYVLAVVASLFAFAIVLEMVILSTSNIENTPVSSKKPKRAKKNKRELRIKIFGRYYELRPILFILLGFLCMLYCILSLPFHGIDKFNKIFRFCTFAFIIVYPLVYYFIKTTFFKLKKDDDYYFKGGDDVAEYLTGLFLGLVLFILLGLIALILFGLFWVGKGIYWITQYSIARFAIVAILLCFFMPRLPKKDEKTLSK